ncbi:MAG: hypothetical protein OEW33_02470, partial [Nitrospirota bacterium]|nr:hypothetical protein [Nitrospirota bacterium]
FAIYIFAIHMLLRRYLSSSFAFFGTFVCLFNVQMFFLSDLCFPDMLYGLLTVGFLLVYTREKSWPSRPWAGVFAITAFASRTAGIVLLAIWIGEGLWKKEWRTAVIRTVVGLVPVVAWFSYVHYVETSMEYEHPAYAYQRADYMFYNVSYAKNSSLIDPFDPALGYATVVDRINRFIHNVMVVPRYIGESVSTTRRVWEIEWEAINKQTGIPLGPSWIVDIPLFALGGLVLFGTAILVIRRHAVVSLCVGSSLLIMFLTPWPGQFIRYLIPIVPLLALSLCMAVKWLLSWLQQGRSTAWKVVSRTMVYLVVIGIIAQQIVTVGAVYAIRHQSVQFNNRQGHTVSYRLFFYMDAFRALDAGLDWLLVHANASDIIAVSMPHWAYLRTGNKAVMIPFESNPFKAQQLMDSVPVTYLILDEGLAIDSKRFTKRIVERFPDNWKRVYSDDIMTETGERHEQAFEIYERVHLQAGAVQPEAGSVLFVPEKSPEENELHEAG